MLIRGVWGEWNSIVITVSREKKKKSLFPISQNAFSDQFLTNFATLPDQMCFGFVMCPDVMGNSLFDIKESMGWHVGGTRVYRLEEDGTWVGPVWILVEAH